MWSRSQVTYPSSHVSWVRDYVQSYTSCRCLVCNGISLVFGVHACARIPVRSSFKRKYLNLTAPVQHMEQEDYHG